MKKIVIAQFVVLFLGTLFAWFNFVWELANWLRNRACTLGCAAPGTNPFLTPCFYGMLFFTASLILSAIILKKIWQSERFGRRTPEPRDRQCNSYEK